MYDDDDATKYPHHPAPVRTAPFSLELKTAKKMIPTRTQFPVLLTASFFYVDD